MSLINEIKADVFTVKGLGVWLVTTLLFMGIAGAWILVNVNFLGNEVAMTLIPDMPAKRK